MKYGIFFAAATALLLSVCSYEGDPYLPEEGDKARFGVIQIGLSTHTPASQPEPDKAKAQP